MKSFLVKIKSSIFFHLLINSIIAVIYNHFFYCEFSTNDDITMARIASGFFGEANEHLVFISSIIGTVLRKMYKVIPNIDWFELSYYFISVVSFSLIGAAFSRNSIKKTTIYYLIIVIVSYSAYCQPQFTKLSSYTAAAGWLLTFNYNELESNKNIVASLLLLLSMMIRFESFAATSLLWIPVFIFHLEKQSFDKSFLKRVIMVVLIATSMYTLTKIHDDNVYNQTGWSEYIELKTSRALLFDDDLPDYGKNIELYNELNISKNSFDLLNKWNFDDKEIINSDVIIKISQRIDKLDFFNLLYKFIYSFTIYCFTKRYMLIYMIVIWLLVIYQLVRGKAKGNVITMLFSFMLMIVCIFYVFYKRETIMSRTNYGFLFSIIILIINLSNYSNSFNLKRFLINVFVIIVLFCYAYGTEIKSTQKERINQNKKVIETLRLLNEDKDNVYLLNVGDVFYNTYCMFDGNNDFCGNIVFLGGWQSCTPIQDDILKKYGINNPYRDIVNNDNCYIINADIDLIISYINDYYDANAYAKFEKSVNGFDVYKILS